MSGWFSIPTPDGNVHVVAGVTLQCIAAGAKPFHELDDWELIMRGVLTEWLGKFNYREESCDH